MTIDFNTLMAWIEKGGANALLVVFAIAVVYGKLVPRWVYEKMEKEYVRQIIQKDNMIDHLLQLGSRSAELTERAASVGERLVSRDTEKRG